MIKSEFKKLDLPENPGVYYFKSGAEILYIGKATSLKDRVGSYFSTDILQTRGPKIYKMIQDTDKLAWTETDSVLEALILESAEIKKHQPPANTAGKDNKSYNYIIITNEDFPRIFTVRGRDLEKGAEYGDKKYVDAVFGPFPHGMQLNTALKIIRRIFPFRGKKSKQAHVQKFYEQLSLAPNISTEDAKEVYATTVDHIKLFLKGKKKTLIKELEREMNTLAKDLRFEEANMVKKKIFALQHIQDIALIKDELKERKGQLSRIEAYDIAHTGGKDTVGVMTVIQEGEPDKASYRKFRIRTNTNGSDTDALRELIRRRLKHDEWRLPIMMVADGSTAQKRVIETALRDFGYDIPVVSVVKDENHRPRGFLGQKTLLKEYETEILLANNEAHRYAIEYHKYLRRKNSLGIK